MNRSRKIVLVAMMVAMQAHALPAQARGGCRDIEVSSPTQSVLLRNSSDREMNLSLSFESASHAALSCGLVSVAAGGDTGKQTLASLCPAAAAASNGVLKACSARVVVHATRGVASGDLLADLQANNLAATGR